MHFLNFTTEICCLITFDGEVSQIVPKINKVLIDENNLR